MKTTKLNFQKALKTLAKGNNRLMYTQSKTPGLFLITDGHIVLTIPAFEFEFFKESNHTMIFDDMASLLDIIEYKPEMEDIKLTTVEISFDGDKKATIFKSKNGKFLSCVNSKYIELVRLTGYGDCLMYGKAQKQNCPIVYNNGLGCGFVLLPININTTEILTNILDFEN